MGPTMLKQTSFYKVRSGSKKGDYAPDKHTSRAEQATDLCAVDDKEALMGDSTAKPVLVMEFLAESTPRVQKDPK